MLFPTGLALIALAESLREEPQESSPGSSGPAPKSHNPSTAPWESTSPDPNRVPSTTKLPCPSRDIPLSPQLLTSLAQAVSVACSIQAVGGSW